MSINKVMLLGRLGQDPELKYTPSGQPVCNFSMATSESWIDKSGQKQEKTEWHRIVVWGKIGELCNQYLSKGSQTFLEGRIQTRSWEGKDGNKRYTTEVIATNVQFIGANSQKGDKRPDNRDQNSNQANSPAEEDYNISTDTNFTADDIPF